MQNAIKIIWDKRPKHWLVSLGAVLWGVGLLLSLGGRVTSGGLILYLAIIYTIYGPICLAVYLCAQKVISQLHLRHWLWLAIIVVAANLFLFWQLKQQNYIHFWDNSNYWTKGIEHSSLAFVDPLATLQNLFQSINHAEYNNMIACLMALPMRLTGNSFIAFSMVSFNMFSVPVVFVLSLLVISVWQKLWKDKFTFQWLPLVVLCLLLVPQVTHLTLEGYPDAFSALPMAAALLLAFDALFTDKQKYLRPFLFGICLLYMLLGRRYYAYALIGIVVGLCLCALLRITLYKQGGRQLAVFVRNMMVGGALPLILLTTVFRGFLLNMLWPAYKTAFSAYQLGSLGFNFLTTLQNYGIVFALLALIALPFFYFRSKGTFFFACFLFCIATITMVAFFQVQSMDIHHRLVLLAPFAVLLLGGFAAIFQGRAKPWAIGALAIALLVGSLNSNGIIQLPPAVASVFPQEKYQPRQRHDIPALLELADAMNKLISEGSGVYLLSSSAILNDNLMQNLHLPENSVSVPGLLPVKHIDLRDGFPVEFLSADYVVVASPVQLHGRREDQLVVALLAEEFLNNGPLSRHFSPTTSLQLDNDVTVTIYRKDSDYTPEDYEYLTQQFNQFYAAYPSLFQDRIRIYTEDLSNAIK